MYVVNMNEEQKYYFMYIRFVI